MTDYNEWCPTCKSPYIAVTRGIPSMGICKNGHKTDRRDALRREPAATPPDHLALVAAAYRDAADKALNGNIETQGHQGMALEISCSTPADAEAHLTALLRAEYERGVREAADAVPVDQYPGSWIAPMLSATRDRILALLTQEER